MGSNLTRFYLDFDEDCRTGCVANLAFEDIETIEADGYEATLKEKDIPYLRVDL
jgi:hypothetical protein